MELKEGKKHTGGLRRPFGVAGEHLFLNVLIFVNKEWHSFMCCSCTNSSVEV